MNAAIRVWTVGLLAVAPRIATTQSVPTFQVARDLRIDAAEHDLSPIGWLAVSPTGTIAISQAQDGLIRFFSSSGVALGTFGRSGAGPGEFRTIAQHGWLRDTLWVDDPSTKRTTFISPSRALIRSVMQLTAITVPGASSDSTPRFFGVFPRALYPDGSALVWAILAAGSTPRWPGADPAGIQYIKVNREGAFVGILATRPANRCGVRYPLPGGGGVAPIPYCGAPMEDLARDGMRYVAATIESQATSRTAYRVTLLRATGDTAFSRRYEHTSEAIPRRFADSVLASWTSRARFPQEEEAYRSMKVPSFYPPIVRVLLGRDDSIWLEEFTPIYKRSTRTWRILDGQGVVMGKLTVPGTFNLEVASRTTLWGTETDNDGLQHVVRYRVSR